MSYLSNYRINFWGGLLTDVCTSNNDDRDHYFVDPIKARLAPNYHSQPDNQVIKELKANPGWNYYGEYTTMFQGAKISSFGEPTGTMNDTGSMIGTDLYLLGSIDPKAPGAGPMGAPILVDMDSTGTSCTQLIVGGLQIGGTNNPLLKIVENTRCYSALGGKSISAQAFGKANTTWQLSFEYNDDWEYDTSNAEMMKLINAAKGAKGITMVFTTFEVMTKYDTQELQAKYNNGEAPRNPVLGYTIGSLGVWEEGEARTCLPGRLLQPQSNTISGFNTFVEVDSQANYVHLNMASTFIKPQARQNRDDLSSMSPTANPGDLHLGIMDNGTAKPLVKIPYDYQKYYLTGGIVSAAVNASVISQLNNADLVLVEVENSAVKTVFAQEQTYRVISDDRGIYVNPQESKTLNFNISKWGKPLTEEVSIKVEFINSGQLAAEFGLYTDMNVSIAKTGSSPMNFVDMSNGVYTASTSIKASEASNFQLDANWIQGGFKQINLMINGSKSPNYYFVIRTYPDDTYENIPDDVKYKWDFIYPEILRYYYIVFPAMATRFPLNDEGNVSAVKHAIIDRISAQYADSTLRMPITRDMSPGKIKLLTEYLNQV